MPDDRQPPPEPERTGRGAEEQGGVFGNLPGTRPTVRSPRRGRERGSTPVGKDAEEPSGPAARAQTGPRPAPPGRGSEPRQRHAGAAGGETPPDSSGEGGGVEDLAWAGIAVAAEAATLGVRLLSRAMGAVRKPPDRR